MILVIKIEESEVGRIYDFTYGLIDRDQFVEIREISGSISTSSYSSNEIYNIDISKVEDKLDIILIEDTEFFDKSSIRNEWIKKYDKIFKYYFVYPKDKEDLTFSFASSVNEFWSSVVKSNNIPNDWTLKSISNSINLLTFKATLFKAIQYGRNEKIAERVKEFDKIEFCKTLSDIDWEGMRLTNPVTKEKENFQPKDLHLTSIDNLYNKIGQEVGDEFIKGYLESTVIE